MERMDRVDHQLSQQNHTSSEKSAQKKAVIPWVSLFIENIFKQDVQYVDRE